MKIIRKNIKNKDCSIIAAFNAASFCNLYKSYSEIEKVAKGCGYNPNKGIYSFQFAALLKKLNIPARKIKAKSIEAIQSKIYLGKFFIISYTPTGYNVGHVVVVFMDHRGNIKIVNSDKERITWDELASDIYANGMKNFNIYEISRKYRNSKNNDLARI